VKADFLALLLGPPGHGKSSLAAELAEARLRQGSWVLAQDANRELGRFCVEYPSTHAFLERVAATAKEGKPMPGGASFATSADAVLRLAVTLGEQWNRARGTVAQPICVVVNETTSFEGAGSTWVGQELASAVGQRRHLGLELVLCMQHAAQLPALIFESATEVHAFRQKRADRIVALERVLGEDPGAFGALRDLPKHRFTTWRPDAGLV